MKHLPEGTSIWKEDRLIKVWRLPSGSCVAQGKRAAAQCPLDAQERKFYVANLGRLVDTVKFIMDRRKCSLSDAWETLKAARGDLT